mgnify:CR=1 FL=1
MFEDETVSYKQIKDTIYWFLYDYADDWAGYRVRELVDPALDFATSIIMDSDLGDLRYLYSYGDYISEVELKNCRIFKWTFRRRNRADCSDIYRRVPERI